MNVILLTETGKTVIGLACGELVVEKLKKLLAKCLNTCGAPKHMI